MQTRLGNDVGLNTTTKIDGSPAVICWSKFEGYPDNSIALKSFIGSAKTALSSIDDIEAKYGDRPEMAEKLKCCLQLARYIPEGEAWQGDCLFTQVDLQEQEIEGKKYLTFHPNKIVYAFGEDNANYESVKEAEFGIAFHTIYKDAGNGAKNQSFRVDPARLNAPSQFYIMSPALDTSKLTFDMDKLNNQYNSLKGLEDALCATSDYEELVHNKSFMEYWNTFENANLADKRSVNIDLETFYEDLWDYIEEKQTKEFSKKFQNLKTVKGKSGAIDNWVEGVSELHDILTRNKNVIVLMVNALNTAANIKMEMWNGFKNANTGVDTFYRSRTKGFFPANMEGIAMSDAEGNIVKIVDRSEFSSANRDTDIMSGWEHPENSNKVIEKATWNKFNRILEEVSMDTVVIGWGRMNPPTIGHLKLVNKMKELALDTQCPARLYLSHSVDKKNECKNPLDYESKIKWATLAFGDLVDVVNSDAKTIIFALHDLYMEGFKHLIYVGGEDRIGGDGDITAMIEKYNGYPAKENMFYEFESIVFENAGHRDENSDDITEKASASYARQLAIEGDFETFKQVEPFSPDLSIQLFQELRTAMHVQESTRKQIVKNLNKIFEEATRISESTFQGVDFAKHTYLQDVIKNLRGEGVKSVNGEELYKMPDRYIGKEDAWQDEVMAIKDMQLGGGKSKYKPLYDKFKELTDLDWTSIDKGAYSGKGKGTRSINSFNLTAMQEAIQALLLTGQIIPDDITIENLQGILHLPKAIDPEEFEIFMSAWGPAFINTYNGIETFNAALDSLNFDRSKMIVLHNYVKNEYTPQSEILFNDYGAATIDKADFYIWNGVGGVDFLNELIRKRKENEGFATYAEQLVTDGILIGISLKKVAGTMHAEWDPIVQDGYFTGDVIWNIAENKKESGTVTNYVNFQTTDGYLVLCIRPNGDGSARTEFRFGKEPNKLSGIAYGSATKPITAMFGENFSNLMNSKSSATPCQDASDFLLRALGVTEPKPGSLKMNPAGIDSITSLFADAAGYGARNADGSRKTAPYIKIY